MRGRGEHNSTLCMKFMHTQFIIKSPLISVTKSLRLFVVIAVIALAPASNAVVMPADGSGSYRVALESSSDLINGGLFIERLWHRASDS